MNFESIQSATDNTCKLNTTHSLVFYYCGEQCIIGDVCNDIHRNCTLMLGIKPKAKQICTVMKTSGACYKNACTKIDVLRPTLNCILLTCHVMLKYLLPCVMCDNSISRRALALMPSKTMQWSVTDRQTDKRTARYNCYNNGSQCITINASMFTIPHFALDFPPQNFHINNN